MSLRRLQPSSSAPAGVLYQSGSLSNGWNNGCPPRVRKCQSFCDITSSRSQGHSVPHGRYLLSSLLDLASLQDVSEYPLHSHLICFAQYCYWEHKWDLLEQGFPQTFCPLVLLEVVAVGVFGCGLCSSGAVVAASSFSRSWICDSPSPAWTL